MPCAGWQNEPEVAIEMEDESDGAANRDEKAQLLKLHEDVAAFFQENLRSADVAKKYLEKRQISLDVARKWQIGYSTPGWDGLIKWANGRKYKTALLEAAGLVVRTNPEEGEQRVYDRFRGRLMFSICDEQGRVVGFSGRILTDEKDQPKYVNSPETAIFHKGRVLFALDKAKRSIIEEKYAVICEGQIDTISCHEAGMTNVVAPQGTALTEQHARILKRYAEESVLMYDADEAGQNAIVRSAEPLWEAGLAMRVAVIPTGFDPDSFIKAHGGENLKKVITKGESFFVYLLGRLSQLNDPHSERGKLQIVRQMAEWLIRVPSPILLSTYAQQTAQRLDVPEDAIRQELRRLQASKRRGPAPQVAAGPDDEVAEQEIERTPNQPAELVLLQAMLADVRIVDMVMERLDPEWLTTSLAAELVDKILKLHAQGQWDGPHSLMNANASDQSGSLVSEVMHMGSISKGMEVAAQDCLATMKKTWLARRIHELRKLLRQGSLELSESFKIQQQIFDMERELRA